MKKKSSFIGWTHKDMRPCWTVFNTLNLTTVIQKTKTEALARYDDGNLGNVIKIKITIEKMEK